MRTWSYSYKTSDGLRHEGEMNAATKDAVYAELRQRGIRAIKVTERIQPVVVQGVKKRYACLGAVILIVLAGAIAFMVGRKTGGAEDVPRRTLGAILERNAMQKGDEEARRHHGGGAHAIESEAVSITTGMRIATPRPRRQIAGVNDKVSFDSIFNHPSERFLARYAQPGFVVEGTNTELGSEIADDFYDALDAAILISPDDAREVVELKRIVAGIKTDIAERVLSGANLNEVLGYLETRQKMEHEFRERTVGADLPLEVKNASLRAMGLEEIKDEKK